MLDDILENSRNNFEEQRNKSKSEIDLKTTIPNNNDPGLMLPDINQRKNVNSAPSLNDIINIVPYSFVEISSPNDDDDDIIMKNTCLPGAILSNNHNNSTMMEQSPKISSKKMITVGT